MSRLTDYTVLHISGPDAERFLQGQFTNNMNDLAEGSASFSACCNAKGRMVANFLIAHFHNTYWLVLPTTSAALLVQHLQKYKVFFKADISDKSDEFDVMASLGQNTAYTARGDQQQLTLQLPGDLQLIISNKSATSQSEPEGLVAAEKWHQQRMREGIHWLTSEQSEQWIPQQLNWHLLGGVSFNKGCYTGQEIIARMQYLGKSKKTLGLYQGPETSTENQQLFNVDGKAIAQVLECYPCADGEHLVFAIVSADPLPENLFADQNSQISLTLQNLPYTVEKTE
jgi:folate-binding protein YgfZ